MKNRNPKTEGRIDRLLIGLFELGYSGFEVVGQSITQGFFLSDASHQFLFATGDEVGQFGLEVLNFVDRHIIHITVLHCP